ncbi:hypothetical protein NDU88_012190 [Pleurodeles waltl]|uniref:Uncharacterized protein n=1 Tax=Pleurodeles waltl TaxID=8319 RepID=A0AAV7R2J5_PLEWA|nr:hypothetical protein NDU88_012190 [Pleurodeles waltl]
MYEPRVSTGRPSRRGQQGTIPVTGYDEPCGRHCMYLGGRDPPGRWGSLAMSDPRPPLQEGSRGTGGVTGHERPEPALTRGLTRHWRCHWP